MVERKCVPRALRCQSISLNDPSTYETTHHYLILSSAIYFLFHFHGISLSLTMCISLFVFLSDLSISHSVYLTHSLYIYLCVSLFLDVMTTVMRFPWLDSTTSKHTWYIHSLSLSLFSLSISSHSLSFLLFLVSARFRDRLVSGYWLCETFQFSETPTETCVTRKGKKGRWREGECERESERERETQRGSWREK